MTNDGLEWAVEGRETPVMMRFGDGRIEIRLRWLPLASCPPGKPTAKAFEKARSMAWLRLVGLLGYWVEATGAALARLDNRSCNCSLSVE